METKRSYVKTVLWTGRVISALCILFLFVDSIMKIFMLESSMQASNQIGWPVNCVQGIGFVLLGCTILYLIPRTSILGAILLTGYLGGATSIMVRAQNAGHPYLFPIFFGILVWLGLFLRDEKLRMLIPVKKTNPLNNIKNFFKATD
jgi:DoxX-like family